MPGSAERFCTVIFAGAADITREHLDAVLTQWFGELEEQWGPGDLMFDPPVIEQFGPYTPAGLKNVHEWLTTTGEFSEKDLERPGNVMDSMTELKPGPDQYLVVLWGDGGDEATEKLVDQACRLGITVLDLTGGMEEFTLESKPPEPAQPPAPSRSVPRRPVAAAGNWITDDTTAVNAGWIPSGLPQESTTALQMWGQPTAETLVSLPGLQRAAAAVLRRALLAALKELEGEADGTPAPVAASSGSGQAVTGLPASIQEAAPAAGNDGPVRYRAGQDAAQPPGTRRYQIDPATGQYRAVRGRPRNDRKDWDFVFLTPEQESDLDV